MSSQRDAIFTATPAHVTAQKLRATVLKLEEEVAQARAVHAADVRALTARLVGEREAMYATMVDALRSSETEGEYSISGLQAELQRLDSRHASTEVEMLATIDELGSRLAQTEDALAKEQKARWGEIETLNGTVRALQGEVARLQAELDESRQQHKNDVFNLTSELKAEEESRVAERGENERRASESSTKAKAALVAVEARLKESREQGYAAREELQRQLKELSNSKDAVEGRLTRQLRQLDERRQYENTMFRSRNEVLTHQVLALKANTSRGRQDLYWASLKSGGAVPMPGGLAQSSSSSVLAYSQSQLNSQSPSRRAASPALSSSRGRPIQEEHEQLASTM